MTKPASPFRYFTSSPEVVLVSEARADETRQVPEPNQTSWRKMAQAPKTQDKSLHES
jgi:hypothetical protein